MSFLASSNNSTHKSTKSKQSSSTNITKSSSSSSESHVNNKNGTSSSHRSKSSSSGKSHPNTNSSTSKSSTTNTNESTSHNVTSTPGPLLDPLSLTSTFPYFLPPFLTPSGTTNPFSNLSTSLLNPTASLYPFLSPDWFTSTLKTSTDAKESIPSSTESSTSKTKKRPKSNQNSTNEQNSQSQLHQTALTNPSLLQSALVKQYFFLFNNRKQIFCFSFQEQINQWPHFATSQFIFFVIRFDKIHKRTEYDTGKALIESNWHENFALFLEQRTRFSRSSTFFIYRRR